VLFTRALSLFWREEERTSSPSDKNNILGEKEKEKEAFDDIFFSSPGEDGAGGV